MSLHTSDLQQINWVRETRFGRWFLGTETWYKYVLKQAIGDFSRMADERLPKKPRILDAACGQGLAFGLLADYFDPSAIVGADIDGEQIHKACELGKKMASKLKVDVIRVNLAIRFFDDAEFDIIFCHQLLHHTAQQQETLAEFYRILKPGGFLLLGESCRSFINSLPVRLFFRHPEMAQRDAQGYIEITRQAGFSFTDKDVQTTRPWWSRRCLGLAQKLRLSDNNKEPTEILILAKKP
jgi:ubiquinone/menaquinone biosynthesis C-methylase UbiE